MQQIATISYTFHLSRECTFFISMFSSLFYTTARRLLPKTDCWRCPAAPSSRGVAWHDTSQQSVFEGCCVRVLLIPMFSATEAVPNAIPDWLLYLAMSTMIATRMVTSRDHSEWRHDIFDRRMLYYKEGCTLDFLLFQGECKMEKDSSLDIGVVNSIHVAKRGEKVRE